MHNFYLTGFRKYYKDTARKSWKKCENDGWLRAYRSMSGDICANFKMLDGITLEDLDILDYNELYDKAKSNN